MNGLEMRRNDRDSIELFSGMTQLWRGRWWILLTTVVVTSLFAALAFWMTPVYRASVIMAPAGQERAGLGGILSSALGTLGGGLASLAGIAGGNGSTQGTDEAVAVLKSRQFTEQFITDRNLLPALYPDLWDPKAAKWRVPADDQPTMATAVKRFQKDVLTITQDKKTGLLTLQIESPDRIAAADWANDLVRRINAWMRARSIASTEASLAYLRKEMEATSVVETRIAISRLLEAQINQRMISSVSEEFSFRVVDRAYAPERGDRARPKKLLMIIFGVMAGLVMGSAGVIVFKLPRPSSAASG